MVFFNQGQRQVHAGRDSGRRVDVPVTHEYRIRVNLDPGILPGELFAPFPMGGGFAPVQQAGPREQHGPRADRADSPDPSRDISNPLDHVFAGLIVLNRASSGYQQRVDLSAHSPKGPMAFDSQPTAGDEPGLARRGDDFDRIDGGRPGVLPREQLRCPSENLKWSNHVEDLGSG